MERRRGAVELQSEMLHLDLIDAEEGGIQEDEQQQQQKEEEEEEPRRRRSRRTTATTAASTTTTTASGRKEPVDAARQRQTRQREGPGAAAPPDLRQPLRESAAPVAMDTYRPKRPTTLNLFPQVPRTQVRDYGKVEDCRPGPFAFACLHTFARVCMERPGQGRV